MGQRSITQALGTSVLSADFRHTAPSCSAGVVGSLTVCLSKRNSSFPPLLLNLFQVVCHGAQGLSRQDVKRRYTASTKRAQVCSKWLVNSHETRARERESMRLHRCTQRAVVLQEKNCFLQQEEERDKTVTLTIRVRANAFDIYWKQNDLP